ncbi:MAG: dependent epimerase/dehydratase family protein [Verrucomicrobiales bacterium]|nr:dependent epimerase/dehydratase family protein [Verrucomicrobiales bacterium]
MPSPSSELTVIAGCGYLGKVIARQLRAEGRAVLGLTHSEESAAALGAEGIDAQACDLTDSEACRAVAGTAACRAVAAAVGALRLVHCAASGRGGGPEQYRAVYLDGSRNLRTAFPEARFFFTSSTSVYNQIDGGEITEDSPAEPDRETGRILRLTEEEALAAGGTVGRLAGIYGPGRSVLLKQFLEGRSVIDIRMEPPATPDGRWINQIHVADAARAILHLLDLAEGAGGGSEGHHASRGARLYNIADSTPLLQRTLYSELSTRFQRPLPPEAPPDVSRKRGWTHKQVRNARLQATGWEPLYPDWFAALDHDPDFLSSIMNSQVAAAAAVS